MSSESTGAENCVLDGVEAGGAMAGYIDVLLKLGAVATLLMVILFVGSKKAAPVAGAVGAPLGLLVLSLAFVSLCPNIPTPSIDTLCIIVYSG